jgi:hypothetical protein
MAQVPSGQKFRTVPENVETKELGSKLANSQREIYTMQDIIDTAGVPGPQGVQGPTGPAGPIGPVGPAGLNWEGAWASGTSYVANDAVGYNGASYFCILATSGTTAPDVDTTHWALLASQGAQGAIGPAGAQGPTGATGPGVPTFFESNAADFTMWNNGSGNLDTNTSFGKLAFASNTTGFNSTAIGSNSLQANTTGNGNTAIGTFALSSSLSGNNNTVIGALSASALTSGAANVIIGSGSNAASSSTSNAIAIGRSAIAGSSAVVIGTGATSSTFTGGVLLGNGATATANNQFVVGSLSNAAGTVTTETVTSTKTWAVVINGVGHKILLA